MFERNLADLIRGLRGLNSSSKQEESKFISQAIDEIRKEIKSKDMELKAAAVLKLVYLDMLGYDMSWASFHVVEVMSSSRIHLKAIGYLAASQSFDEKTDVLMLTTNTFKKDLTSAVPAEISASVNALSHVISPDLARDLSIDLVAMLNHSRPYIRKRAVLAMYKVFVKYPEALPHSFARFREKLEDSDPGVVSATVNVLCEIARQNPENYLPLAPQLFHILTTSSNNWMLIKVIKLFGALAPFEPRLVKKLQAPITDLISTTPAVSLLYECVRTCIIGGMLQGSSGDVLAKTCVEKLATFLEDSDQNLKYIALLALVKIVPSHPHLVAVYQDVILASINDQDISIRMRSLELLTSMVTPYNLQSIVQQLLAHLVPSESATAGLPDAAQSLARATTASAQASTSTTSPSTVFGTAYRLEVSRRILDMCSRDTYENVQDFEWYLSVLVDLSYVANVDVGVEIKNQLMDVAVRVKAVRRYAVTLMTKLLSDDTLLLHANDEGNCTNVLWAAAWICGEYCRELVDPQKALDYLLQPNVSSLSPDIISVYLQSALKIFGYWAAEIADRWRDDFLDEVKRQVEVIVSSLGEFIRHSDIEVQERALNMHQLFTFIQADIAHRPQTTPLPTPIEGDGIPSSSAPFTPPATDADPSFPKSLYLLRPLFTSYELNYVATTAQANVRIPDGLDLDVWIIPIEKEAVQAEGEAPKNGTTKVGKKKEKGMRSDGKSKRRKKGDREAEQPDIPTATPEERAERKRQRAERMERMRDDPYYIRDTQPPNADESDDGVDDIPIVQLVLDDLPQAGGPSTLLSSAKVPSSASSLRIPTPSYTPPIPAVIDKDGEMPENVSAADAVGSRPQSVGPSSTAPRPPLVGSAPSLEQMSFDVTAPAGIMASTFHQYDAVEERPATPQPIKVKRKKKTTGKSKKAAL